MELAKKVNSDFYLRLATFALIGFGFIMVASSSTNFSAYYYEDPWYFTLRQGFWVVVGIVCMVIVSNMRPSFIEKHTFTFFTLVMLMLLAVLLFGVERNGAKSWLGIGFLGIQPTEFAKIAVVLGLAKLIANRRELFSNYRKGLIPSLIMLLIVVGFIMAQPDFGSTLIICGAAFFMLYVGGVQLKHLGLLFGVTSLILAIYVMVLISAESYKIDRYSAFVNPWADMEGTGFQLVQSMFAFGHGGLTGVGYGESIQKLPMYLPMAYNDFIFPIIGEELGFIGVCLFFAIFLGFLGRSLMISLKSKNLFWMLTGVGIVTMLSMQAIVNIGGVTGSMPMTGVTLPFISYGGSSLLATMLCVGLLLNISKNTKLTQQKNVSSE
jgi:cell division protein FtsW